MGFKLVQLNRNENVGKDFMHYIAMAKWQVLLHKLSETKFFSLLLDGSTDKGNVDNKSCWLCGVIQTGVMRRYTPGWIISW